jgi:integrase
LLDVLSFLPECYHGAIRVTYATGWRMHNEVLTLTWDRIDFEAGEIWLYDSKNGEARAFPMNNDLRAILLAQRAFTEEIQRKIGKIINYVFHAERWVKQPSGPRKLIPGQPIKGF